MSGATSGALFLIPPPPSRTTASQWGACLAQGRAHCPAPQFFSLRKMQSKNMSQRRVLPGRLEPLDNNIDRTLTA